MKSSLLLRLLLILSLTFGFSALPLLAQEGGQRGQRGQGGGQRQGGLGDMSKMTPEERQAHLQNYINKNIVDMLEASQVREDQQKPFAQAQVKYETAVLKIMMQMQAAGRDRDKRQKLAQERNKATSDVTKAMKEILDKDQMKLYQAKMKERTPQRGGGRQR